jgi:di/tricarboxylate transporter
MFRFFRCRKATADELESQASVQNILKQQYEDLGPFCWQERTITILFVIVVILWVTRDFSTAPGWGMIFQKK